MARTTIADRLRQARRAGFVGRDAELELFRRAVHGGAPEPAVLYVHGPGGVGKTTLLAMFAELVAGAGRPLVHLDARTVEASPPGFRAAAGEVAAGSVLLLDTYELLAPLDDWLRESYLPSLPDDVLVVLAGRSPPAPGWVADLGWRDLVRVVSLRNLRPGESRAYLSARGVTDARQDSVVAFTHGHPLALALVADVLGQVGGDELAPFRPEQEPDLVRVLLERFVAQVPSRRHRAALEACAHLRVTSESLLADALGDAAGGPDSAELYGWLRGLSFVEHGPEGVFPHDLAREVLDADLRWRNPPGYRRLHVAARTAILRRIQGSQGIAQQRALFDFMFMHRNNPITGRYYDWESLGHTYAEPATDQDLGQILSLVERYEGSESARIAQHWYARQPAAFTSFRNVGGDLIGFLATVTLTGTAPEDIEPDPAARAAVAYTRRHGPLCAGDELIYHRFQMSPDAYQRVSPATNLLAVSCCRHWLTRPGLAWTFLAVADADQWRPLFSHLNFRSSPEAAFEVGGRRYAVFSHDWRAEPPLAWYELMGERELMSEPVPPALPPPAASLVVLSEPEFGTAVRRALRDYTRPDALATSPLLRSRVLVERAGRAGPADLRAVLREAAEALQGNPRDERFYRAVRCTYLEPAATQERAAERLGLPFSTYRSHLGSGIDRITGWLWRRELSGQPDRAES